MEKIREFCVKYGIYFLIFILALSLRILVISQKQYMFYDSPFSIMMSTPNNLSPDGEIFKKRWDITHLNFGKNYTLKEYKKALFENKASIKSIIKDLKTLRHNKIDTDHTNLYYSILRIWNSGLDGIDIKQIINRSCSLNLVFFAFSFFFLYKLLSLIKDDKWFISIGLFFGFLSTGTISNTLLIREYALQEMCFTAFIYVFMLLYKNLILENNNEALNIKNCLLFGFVTVMYALSGYFSLVVIIPGYLFLLINLLLKKQKQPILKILTIILLSSLILLLIYPPYFTNIFATKHNLWAQVDIFEAFFDFKNIFNSFISYFLLFSMYNCIFYILIYILPVFNVKIFDDKILNKNELKLIYITLLFTFLYVYFISFYRLNLKYYPGFFPDHGRFLMIVLPVLSILFVLIMYRLKKYWIKIFMGVFAASVILLICEYNPPYSGEIIYKNNWKNEAINKNILFSKYADKNYPVIIHIPTYNKENSKNKNVWLFSNYINNIMYMQDDTILRFEQTMPSDKYIYDNYFLLSNQDTGLSNNKLYKTICQRSRVGRSVNICLIKKIKGRS